MYDDDRHESLPEGGEPSSTALWLAVKSILHVYCLTRSSANSTV